MEEKKIIYKSQSYNALRAFLYVFPIYALLTIAIILVFKQLQLPGLAAVVWVIVSLVPFAFQKRFKEIFTKNIELSFDSESLVVREYHVKSDKMIKEFTLFWKDMGSFQFSLSSKVAYITIHMRSGEKHKLSFKEEITPKQLLEGQNAINLSYFYICQFNSNNVHGNGIILKANFLNTKSGTVMLYSLIFLAIAAIVVHIVLAPSTFMFSFMGFFIIIGLFLKRKTDSDLYDKIKQANPRSPFE